MMEFEIKRKQNFDTCFAKTKDRFYRSVFERDVAGKKVKARHACDFPLVSMGLHHHVRIGLVIVLRCEPKCIPARLQSRRSLLQGRFSVRMLSNIVKANDFAASYKTDD